jgi:hypothetical protein
MLDTLEVFVADFAAALMKVDQRRPVACNARTGVSFQPGIGPHSESATVQMVMVDLQFQHCARYSAVSREIPYAESARQKCDLCLGSGPAWNLCIEIKMLRLMGDNGKPNDNMLMHILSPYAEHRSAVTDCEKLATSRLSGRKAVVVFAYEYPAYPAEPVARAFELLAAHRVCLGRRAFATSRI